MNELHARERENANKRPCNEGAERDRDHRRVGEQDKEKDTACEARGEVARVRSGEGKW